MAVATKITSQDQRNFVVEGNIGAGKSTFLKILQNHLSIQAVFEPHERWQHAGGAENLLEKFYVDTPRWAYTFQTYAFVTRVMEQQEQAKINPFPAQILERSVFSDRYCFAKNCFELGSMSTLEWKLYCEWFSWLVDNYVAKPAGFIYLRTDPQVCYQRLLKRDRHEEAAVSVDYIEKLHAKHEGWLVARQDVAPYLQNVPVLILNCDQDFEHNLDEQSRHIAQVLDFLNEHCTIPVQAMSQATLTL